MELVFLKNMLKHPGCWNIFQERDFEEDSLLLFFLAALQKTERSSVSVLFHICCGGGGGGLSAIIVKKNKCQEIQDVKPLIAVNKLKIIQSITSLINHKPDTSSIWKHKRDFNL